MAESTCVVEGCDKPRHYAAGWCPMHYQRVKTRGTTDPSPPRAKPLCECGEPVRCKGLCRACYRRDCYVRNKDHENESTRAYYAANAGTIKARAVEWRRQNPGASTENARKNRDSIRARYRELSRDPAWRERQAEYGRRSRAKNYEAWALRNRENQRRRRRLDGKPVDFNEILDVYGFQCHICLGAIIGLADLHMDHVVPLSRGGTHTADNIRPAHAFCNLSKGSKLMEEMVGCP